MFIGAVKSGRVDPRGLESFCALISSASIFLRGLCIMKKPEFDESLAAPAMSLEKSSFVPSVVTRIGQQCSSSKAEATPEIEKNHVHRVYDAIAPHFSSTRFAKWPKVQTFLNSLPRGSLILDAGCGNGKYLGLNTNCYYIGCDISSPLVHICADKGNEVLVADAVNLPYRSGYGDAAISIAVLHHLSTELRRKRAVEELIRVVKPGGVLLITVWAKEQEDESLITKWTPLTHKYTEDWVGSSSPRTHTGSPSFSLQTIPESEESFTPEPLGCFLKERLDETSQEDHANRTSNSTCQHEYLVPWHLPYHRAEVSGASATALSNGLARKDDKKGAVVYDRYYHVFSEGELERLVSCVDGAIVVDKFYDKSNWCIILKKLCSE